MGSPYSQDLRDRILSAYDRGMKTKQIATLFLVSSSWARRVKQRRRETGETTPRKMGSPGVIKVDRARLLVLIQEHPDATATELRDLLGVDCATSTIYMALKQMNITFKKKRSMPRSKSVRMSHSVVTGGNHGPKVLMPAD